MFLDHFTPGVTKTGLTRNLPWFCSLLTLPPVRKSQARPRRDGGIPFWQRSFTCYSTHAQLTGVKRKNEEQCIMMEGIQVLELRFFKINWSLFMLQNFPVHIGNTTTRERNEVRSNSYSRPSCVFWPSTCPSCWASPAILPPAPSAPGWGLLQHCGDRRQMSLITRSHYFHADWQWLHCIASLPWTYDRRILPSEGGGTVAHLFLVHTGNLTSDKTVKHLPAAVYKENRKLWENFSLAQFPMTAYTKLPPLSQFTTVGLKIRDVMLHTLSCPDPPNKCPLLGKQI